MPNSKQSTSNQNTSNQSTSNQSTDTQYKPYLASAYKGIQRTEYRNTAQKDQRQGQSMLARDQCGRSVLPRGKIYNVCWEHSDHPISNKSEKALNKRACIRENDNQLRLPLASSSNTNAWDIIEMIWAFGIITSFIFIPLWMFIYLLSDGMRVLPEIGVILAYWLIGLVVSKILYKCVFLFKQKEKYIFVIFNRSTGNIEFPSPDRQSLLYYPFAEFNAHHRTVHTQNGLPQYGLTLLHYKEQIMYQVILGGETGTIMHWEQLQNFMDVTQPLPDIPSFEQFRQQDKLTAELDKKNNRPKDFWYRVDKVFYKKVLKIVLNTIDTFPEGCLHYEQALKKGYKVPDIIITPWKHIETKLPQTHLARKQLHWFIRYCIEPFMVGGAGGEN